MQGLFHTQYFAFSDDAQSCAGLEQTGVWDNTQFPSCFSSIMQRAGRSCMDLEKHCFFSNLDKLWLNLEITDPGFLTQSPKQDVSYFPVIALV